MYSMNKDEKFQLLIHFQNVMSFFPISQTWGDAVLGTAAFIIPVSVALSTFGAANGACFAGGRLVERGLFQYCSQD